MEAIETNLNIADEIRHLLYEHRSVALPGLGSFVSAYKSASVDHLQGMLYPPAYTLRFDANFVQDDGILTDFIAQKYELPLEQAQMAVSDFVLSAQSLLDTRELLVFTEVGRLYRDFNHQLQFLPDNTNFNVDSFALPSVQYYPVSRVRDAVASSASDQVRVPNAAAPVVEKALPSEQFLPESTAQIPAPALIPKRRNLAMPQLSKVGLFTPSLLVLGIIVLAIAISWVKTADETTTVPTAPLVKTKQNVNVSPHQEGLIESIPIEPLTANPDAPNADNKPSSRPHIADEREFNAPQQGETTQSVPLDLAPKGGASNGRQAIAIIGAYVDKRNISQLINQVQKAGYQPYTVKKGEKTLIGCRLNYSDAKDLGLKLRAIRAHFGADTWVMKR
jgi:CCDC81-like prokaryotic HU domain 2/CCDC81-like prokaryotic HU domain 1